MKDIKIELRALLENLEVKSVKLKEVKFKTSELSVDNQNVEVEIDLKHKILKGNGETISILYTFRENTKLKRENIQILISYELLLGLKSPMDVKRKVLEAYASNPGLLFVYPYIRHQVDTLKREAGYVLPPLPHVLLKL